MTAAVRTPNVFSGPYLDRVAHLRKDPAFLAAALADPEALVLPLWQSRSLVRTTGPGRAAALLESTHELRRVLPEGELLLLGRFRGRLCFAAELEGEAAPAVSPDARFEDLRAAGALLPQDEAGLLACARALVLWRRRHRHCGSCGAPTRPESAGHVMRCTAASCGAGRPARSG